MQALSTSPLNLSNRNIESNSCHHLPEEAISNSLSFAKKKLHYYIAKNMNESKEPIANISANNQKSNISLKKTIKEEDNEDEEQLNTSLHKENEQKQTESANIFQNSKNYDISSFSELNTGPRFKKTGEIIPYSIIGKSDSFMKNYNIIKNRCPNNNNMKSYNVLDEIKTPKAVNIKKTENYRIMNNASPLSRKPSFKSSSESLDKLQQSPNSRRTMLKKVNKEQLLKELTEYEKLRLEALQKDEEILKNLKFSDRLYVTKERRILEKFEKDNEKWKKNIESLCSSVHRSLDKTVMLQYEEYRKNREKAEEIEKLKDSIKKKLTYKDERSELFWYLSLRNYPRENNHLQPRFASHNKCKIIEDEQAIQNMARLTLLHDLPSGFQTGVVESKMKEIEKIREPFLRRIKGEFNKSTTSFTNKYNLDILDMLNEEDKVSDFKTAKDDELDDLEVFFFFIIFCVKK